jgi:hypothetical protein
MCCTSSCACVTTPFSSPQSVECSDAIHRFAPGIHRSCAQRFKKYLSSFIGTDAAADNDRKGVLEMLKLSNV